MSTFLLCIEQEPVIIAEGAVIERLRRTPGISLNPHLLNSALLYNEGKKYLEAIYRQYIDCAYRRNLPMIILTPTWRANPERISRAGLPAHQSSKNVGGRAHDVNKDCYDFLAEIRAGYGEYAKKIFIGGLMGCYGDAYKPEEALPSGTARFFHREQVRALASSGVDFLLGSTLPAFSEALGMAQAMADSGCPYILSFVIRANCRLLDGMLLPDAINNIDTTVSPKPTGYMINCVHPEIFRKAIIGRGQDQDREVRCRILGLQANTSLRSPEELDGREELDVENPDRFGEMMASLHKDFSLKILGGCCGTDERHIESIVRSLTIQNK
ncbi:MAG: homocysteine S-methyltransferase family protein [Bacteroidota bacterium]